MGVHTDSNGSSEQFTKKQHPVNRISRLQLLEEDITRLEQAYLTVEENGVQVFADLPLSQKTLKGLNEAEYAEMSLIQRRSILHSLRGKDVLGAAKTGSGKTLAFVIPVLEILYRLKWVMLDGMGALIVSPTRELAYQTFNVLKTVGKYHDFSAALIFGGKNLKQEAECIAKSNIVVCTPGRLLQHMDETWDFRADNLKMLVLDEADRTLDLGFAQTMKLILENLPAQRQTLLFSATQTKSIMTLVSLGLRDPIFIHAHEDAEMATPDHLDQSYIICHESEKINLIWSFLKFYHRQKILVFVQTCKQVKFLTLLFKKLRPGIPVMGICGRMGQAKRMTAFEDFCEKNTALMFATDVAARGLDFPLVNWVIQLDCCPDANTYIHRVGRTARFDKDGCAALIVRPSEVKIIKKLKQRRIPIGKIELSEGMMLDISSRVSLEVSGDQDLIDRAKKALVTYLKSMRKLPDRDVFDVATVDVPRLALSYGIQKSPRIRFLDKHLAAQQQQKKQYGEKSEHLSTSMEDEHKQQCTDKADESQSKPKEIVKFGASVNCYESLKNLDEPSVERFVDLISVFVEQAKINTVNYKDRIKAENRIQKRDALKRNFEGVLLGADLQY